MKSVYLSIIFVLGLTLSSSAQIGIAKFNVGYSQWTRYYSGNDERIFFSTNPDAIENFTSKSSMPTISAELSLLKGLTKFGSDWIGVEGRIGQSKFDFSNKFEFDGKTVNEGISQRVIPFSVSVIYHAEIASWLSFYAGTGMNMYNFQETVTRTVSSGEGSIDPRTFTALSYGWTNQIGAEFWVLPRVAIGIEGRQHYGSYNKFRPLGGGEAERLKIDLRGLEFGASVRYRLSVPQLAK